MKSSMHHPARHRLGFTLTEMLIVLGIIVLLLATSVPLFNVIRGNRSLEGAQNRMAAILGRARARAIGMQENTGVFFYLDPRTRATSMVLVYHDPKTTDSAYIEVLPDSDVEPFQPGTGVQFLTSGTERYIGSAGLVMFDARGQTINMPYAISAGSQLAALRWTGPGPVAALGPAPSLVSQVAMILYDTETFHGKGFTDEDLVSGGGANEAAEEQWLDQNGLAVLVNRYNGTLFKAE